MEYGTKEYWRASIALALGSFLIFAVVYSTQPLLPLFTREFGVSPAVSSLSLSVVIFSIGIALLFFGPLSDAVGRKPVMAWTMLGAIVATLLTGFVADFSWMVAWRGLQGLFLAGLPSIAMAYMSEEFSPKALGVSIGIYISANSLGGMSGRLLSGFVAEHWGWQATFWVTGAMGILFFFLFIFLLPPSTRFHPQPLRFKDAVRSMWRHVKNPRLRGGFLVGGLHFFVFVGVFNYMTFLLSEEPYRLSPSLLGMLFLSYLAGSVSSTLSGQLSSKWGKTGCLLVGILIFAGGLMFTLFSSLYAILIGLILQCFGFFFAHSASAGWVNSQAEFAKASASSLYLFSYYLGGSLGSFYLGFFWNMWRWPGVVVGSLIVLAVTAFYSYRLFRLERGINIRHTVHQSH